MTQKQVQKKALTSGRIAAGAVVEGEVVLNPPVKRERGVPRSIPRLPDLRFNAAPWDKARKQYNEDVATILNEIDIARHLLGCAAQAREDARQANLIPRWASAAEPTGAYPVLARD